MRAFRKRSDHLQIKGSRLLIFEDYSTEVSKRSKTFSNICTVLVHKKICFQIYTATLRIFYNDGSIARFNTSDEAEEALIKHKILKRDTVYPNRNQHLYASAKWETQTQNKKEPAHQMKIKTHPHILIEKYKRPTNYESDPYH